MAAPLSTLAIVALGTGLTFVMFGISSFLIFRWVWARGQQVGAVGIGWLTHAAPQEADAGEGAGQHAVEDPLG